jgi:hypothetical protein
MNDAQPSYIEFIARLKKVIQDARLQTIQTVNQQLLLLYWQIGDRILQMQNTEGWGTKVIDRISNDASVAYLETPVLCPDRKQYAFV